MSLNSKFSKPTPFFGLQLWVVTLICIAIISILLVLIFLSICIFLCRKNKLCNTSHICQAKPICANKFQSTDNPSSLDRRKLLSRSASDLEMIKPDYNVIIPDQWSTHSSHVSNNVTELNSVTIARSPMVATMGRGDRFTMREIEAATNGLSDDSVIGSGNYGIVYRGALFDGTLVAVKKLWSYSFQAKNLKPELESIGLVRHKNLVRLLGYCLEGAHRMLVYEYVDNGNLHQWLHNCVEQVSPLTWSIRKKIILGIAKGLAYLHEDVEPKVVHQDIKSSNILLDRHWNPKLSDFGLAKLVSLEESHFSALASKASNYAAERHASIGVSIKKSDVYSFGVVIMEIISGRSPLDYTQPQLEINLIDWLKSMVAKQKCDRVVDPKLPEMPPLKELKRVLLIALRCVDPEVKNRPKMGNVIHMLEPRDLLLSDDHVIRRENWGHEEPGFAKFVEGDCNGYEGDISGHCHKKLMLKY